MEYKDFKDIPKVIGLKQSLKQIKKGNVSKVVLAEDTDENIKKDIQIACENAKVPVIYCKSKVVLGEESGIERSAAVVALIKE